MATAPAEHPARQTSSPVLANIVVIVGFVLLFTTFVTDSPWSWIIGGALIVAGGLWAGFAGGARPTTDDAGPPAVEGARAVREGAEPPAEPVSGQAEQGDGRPA